MGRLPILWPEVESYLQWNVSPNHWTARLLPPFFWYFYIVVIWITYNKHKSWKKKWLLPITQHVSTVFINLTEVVSQITQLRFHALKEKKDDLSMKKKPLFFLYLMLQGDNPTWEIQSTELNQAQAKGSSSPWHKEGWRMCPCFCKSCKGLVSLSSLKIERALSISAEIRQSCRKQYSATFKFDGTLLFLFTHLWYCDRQLQFGKQYMSS